MTPGPRYLAATGNPHKLAELEEILTAAGIALVAPAAVGWDAAVEEDAPTLEGNARKKAEAGLAASGLPTLADDTGLFVDALDGAPGVWSARYAGEAQDAAANCAKLLRALDGVPAAGRTAAFRCVIALADPEDGVLTFEGIVRGRILDAPRGEGGFGYDPLFVPDGETRSFAEMPAGEKHGISHRGRALARLREYVASHA